MADVRGYPSAQRFDAFLGFRARHAFQAAGQNKGRAGQAADFLLFDFEIYAGAQQFPNHFAILALGEKARDAFRDFGADLADFDEYEFSLNRLERN